MIKNLIAAMCFLITASGCSTALEERTRSDVLSKEDLSPEIRRTIMNKKIMVGMTKDQVIASWGKPCSWCYGTRQSSTGDTWEYSKFGSSYIGVRSSTYLYFDNRDVLRYWVK